MKWLNTILNFLQFRGMYYYTEYLNIDDSLAIKKILITFSFTNIVKVI